MDPRHVLRVPFEGHLAPVRAASDLLERRPADEIAVELDVEAVAQVVGRAVIVLDIVRDEGAADRARRLVAVRRHPSPVRRLGLAAGVDRRERRGNPARFERVRGISAAADLGQAEAFARLDQRGPDLLALLVRPPEFEPRRARHAVAQRLDPPPADIDPVHVEEFDVRHRAAVCAVQHFRRIRPLDLETVVPPRHRPAHRPRRRAVVPADDDVVAAGLGVELEPGDARRPADQVEAHRVVAEADHVADHMAAAGDRHDMPGPADRPVGDRVDDRVAQEPFGVGAFDRQFGHVVRLVEQHRRFAPGPLLVAPVGEFRRDDRIDIGADPAVAQVVDDIAGIVEHVLERCGGHSGSLTGFLLSSPILRSPNRTDNLAHGALQFCRRRFAALFRNRGALLDKGTVPANEWKWRGSRARCR